MATTTIVIVTYAGDIRWTEYNLRSIRKFARGFDKVLLIIPLQQLDQFLPLERYGTKETPVLIKTFLEYPGKGMVHHEGIICCADIYAPNSDFILHTDSDCIFTEPVTPDDYITGGKPVLVIKSYEALKDHGCYAWKKPTEDALGFEVLYETMQRHPAVHHKGLYKPFRERVEAVHAIPFIDYVLRARNEYPQTFAEFDSLGAYAIKHFHDKYHWVDLDKQPSPKDKLKQSWSHWSRRDPAKAEEIFKELEKIVS